MELDEETTFGEWFREYRSQHGGRKPHSGDAWVAGRESIRSVLTEQLAIFSRLQSEHSYLIERERLLEAELNAIPWSAIKTLTYEMPTSREYIMAMATVADWLVWHMPRVPNIVSCASGDYIPKQR